MTAVLELPPLQKGIRTLTDEEAEKLKAEYPESELPSSPKTGCVTCKGVGTFMWLDSRGQPAEYKCNCVDQWIMHRYFLYCGIGIHYQRLAWVDIRGDHPAIEFIVDYVDNSERHMDRGKGMVLYGPNGTGKTLFSVLLLKMLLGKGHDGYLTTFQDMLDAFRNGFRDTAARNWFHRRVKNAGFLVMDDVGKEQDKADGYNTDILTNIVRHRVAHARPTIITTNFMPERIHLGYGNSLVSLLAEGALSMEFTGEDFRKTKLEDRNTMEESLNLTRPITVAG